MQRMDTFKITKRPYAVDLSSLQARWDESTRNGKPLVPPSGTWDREVGAVWFRRRRGVTVACIGRLWDIRWEGQKPETAAEFLETCRTGGYGGDCKGRWDGECYWGAQEPEQIQRHLDLLRPMLENYPEIPRGYDGWWVF